MLGKPSPSAMIASSTFSNIMLGKVAARGFNSTEPFAKAVLVIARSSQLAQTTAQAAYLIPYLDLTTQGHSIPFLQRLA
jgi:hypothetical protein